MKIGDKNFPLLADDGSADELISWMEDGHCNVEEASEEVTGKIWPMLCELEDCNMLLIKKLKELETVVNKQAEDVSLWCDTDSVVEAYIQQELRVLHKVIEQIVIKEK